MAFLYDFPRINTFSDIAAAIYGCHAIKVVEKDDIVVVTYSTPDLDDETFDHHNPTIQAIRRECRGLIFDVKTDKLIRRPYHKFFNVGERDETMISALPMKGFDVLEKLDGSMIAPYLSPSTRRLVWGTKAGATEISEAVRKHIRTTAANIRYEQFARALIADGITPIFEWCSLSNKIVIEHEEDRLVLTGAREMVSGLYFAPVQSAAMAAAYGVPVVASRDLDHALFTTVADETGTEGYVLRHASGHAVKLKTPWYVGLHRLLSRSSDPRVLFGAFLDGRADDILSQLTGETRDKLDTYFRSLAAAIDMMGDHLEHFAMFIRGKYSRKEFAQNDGYDPTLKTLVFRAWDSKSGSGKDIIRQRAESVRNSRKKLAEFLEKVLLGITAPRIMFGEEDAS